MEIYKGLNKPFRKYTDQELLDINNVESMDPLSLEFYFFEIMDRRKKLNS